jgi:hypothetical protein
MTGTEADLFSDLRSRAQFLGVADHAGESTVTRD